MTNKEIANAFAGLADVMELHDENVFKIRSYRNAYLTLRKLDGPLAGMSRAEMNQIKGVGEKIGDKIEELLKTGKLQAYEKYAANTPPGVIEMLHIKGLGHKKLLAVWKELDVENVGELIYACNENRLIELHGFGAKTQAEILKAAEYYQRSKNKLHFIDAENEAGQIIRFVQSKIPGVKITATGEVRRLLPVVDKIELLTIITPEALLKMADNAVFTIETQKNDLTHIITAEDTKMIVRHCSGQEFGSALFNSTGNGIFLDAFQLLQKEGRLQNYTDESAVFSAAGLPFIEPELRENAQIIEIAAAGKLPKLITVEDIKGVVHAHTNYSDGVNTLEEMAHYAQERGFKYLTITDHSKSAFYANGLKEDRLIEQWDAIDQLNRTFFSGFRVLKGIESDILNDGSLDYEEDILKRFDLIVASVHSNLKMTEEKATARLIKAVENPYTTILGHPTGRLLLSRQGYPIDHKKVIDACAANGVAIELNAHPYRLDLDWTWIPYAVEKGAWISINPDAHSCAGIDYLRYGVLTARKGGLEAAQCLNCLSADDFDAFCKTKKG